MKIKIIIGIIVVLIFVSLGWFLFRQTPPTPNEIIYPNTNQVKNNTTEPKQQSSFQKPTEKFIVFKTEKGDVRVNNFYTNAELINLEGDTQIKQVEGYSLHYLAEEKKFAISLATINILETQKKAENDFLQILNVTKPDACKLGIFIFIDKEYNTEGLGRQPLSFCPSL